MNFTTHLLNSQMIPLDYQNQDDRGPSSNPNWTHGLFLPQS
jgi:hypothetical protein